MSETLLVGLAPGSFASSASLQINRCYVRHKSGDSAVDTGTAMYGYWYFGSGTWIASNMKMLIYNSSKNLIATSDVLSSFTQSAWNKFTFTSGPTITSGLTYYVAIIADNTWQCGYTGSVNWEIAEDTSGTYASPPDPFGAGTNGARDAVGGYIVSEDLSAIELEGFRFRNDDGSESAATWNGSQDTNITLAADTAARLRMVLNATYDPASIGAQLEARYKPSGGSFGPWTKVTS